MKPKVTVLGWYGHNNCGDEAYKIAFPMILPDYDFRFTETITAEDDNAISIVLGGGDVLQKSFFEQLAKTSKPKHALSVNLLNNEKLPMVLQTFKQIYVRNFVNLTNFSSNGHVVGCLPDFTFILEPCPVRGKQLIQKLFKRQHADQYEKVVIAVINSYLTVGSSPKAKDHVTFDKFAWDMAGLMDNTSASFLFIPFGSSMPCNDRIPNSAVYSRCKYWKKNVVVYDELSVQDTLDIFSAADASLCSRLHASVFSTIGGTPFIDMKHHDKTRLFLEFIDRKDWSVNYWRCNFDKIESLLNQFLSQKDHREGLLEISRNNRNLLVKAKEYLKL